MPKKQSLLIVDDDCNLCEAIKEALIDEYHIVYVESAEQALSLLKSEKFDGIILDIRLPGADGFQMMSLLNDVGYKIPVIVISAVKSIGDAVRSIRLGAYDYCEKPFDIKDLKKSVKNAILKKPDAEASSSLISVDVMELIKKNVQINEKNGTNLKTATKQFEKICSEYYKLRMENGTSLKKSICY